MNDIRLSDRDRTRALTRLARHHRAGRIDAAEYTERQDVIRFARTHGDLAEVFADLEPFAGSHPAVPFRGPARAWRRGWLPFPFLPILLVVAIVIAATGHVPWIPLVVLGVLLLVFAPWRRRRIWSGRGWAC